MTFEAACGETRFPTICENCREPERVMGPPKRRWIKCGCPERQTAPARDRTLRRGKSTTQIGAAQEKRVRKETGGRLQPASGSLAGKVGSMALTGDLRAEENGTTFKIEVKASEYPIASVVGALGGCDAIVVNHKREAFVFCRLSTWRALGRPVGANSTNS